MLSSNQSANEGVCPLQGVKVLLLVAQSCNSNCPRQKDFFFDAYLDLCSSANNREFALKTEDWLMKILNFPNARFIFVENQKFVFFRKDGT